MLFVTNHPVLTGPETAEGRSLRFHPEDREPRASLVYGERLGPGRYREIGSERLFARLAAEGARHILLYVHGFSNPPEEKVFPTALHLQRRLRELGLAVTVVPLIWPCGIRLGYLRDYFADQDSADMSGFAFARLLGRFLDWREGQSEPCLRHLEVLAHSMGNRVLRAALVRFAELHGAVPAIFRNVFMVAADVANETLEPGHSGHVVTRAARNVLVYYAPDDFALRTSKLVNLANRVVSRRLGHTGPESLERTPRNVVAVDCDLVNDESDPLGHTYFLDDGEGRPGAVLHHVAFVLRTGTAARRPGLRHLRLLPPYRRRRGAESSPSSTATSRASAVSSRSGAMAKQSRTWAALPSPKL